MNNDILEVLVEKILEHYGIEEGDYRDSGCYIDGKWLSVERIISLIEELDEEY